MLTYICSCQLTAAPSDLNVYLCHQQSSGQCFQCRGMMIVFVCTRTRSSTTRCPQCAKPAVRFMGAVTSATVGPWENVVLAPGERVVTVRVAEGPQLASGGGANELAGGSGAGAGTGSSGANAASAARSGLTATRRGRRTTCGGAGGAGRRQRRRCDCFFLTRRGPVSAKQRA